MRRLVAVCALLVAVSAAAQKHRAVQIHNPAPVTPPAPQQVILTPSKDNTLFESGNGSLSDGAGIHLFSGLTNNGGRRRALLAFDVASKIPAGSTINNVTLTLQVSQTVAGIETLALHAVSADWGEGTSDAGPFRDGGGASARTNDATWLHRFSPNTRWTNAGGDFDSSTDATAAADGSFSTVTFASTNAMIARVQHWLDQPSANFGWIIIGNESARRSTKEFSSRETTDTSARPTLTVDYTPK